MFVDLESRCLRRLSKREGQRTASRIEVGDPFGALDAVPDQFDDLFFAFTARLQEIPFGQRDRGAPETERGMVVLDDRFDKSTVGPRNSFDPVLGGECCGLLVESRIGRAVRFCKDQKIETVIRLGNPNIVCFAGQSVG